MISYKCIGLNLNVMRQSASLVFNQITVDYFASFFNCRTPVGRASVSKIGIASFLSFAWPTGVLYILVVFLFSASDFQ